MDPIGLEAIGGLLRFPCCLKERLEETDVARLSGWKYFAVFIPLIVLQWTLMKLCASPCLFSPARVSEARD